jgi:hypothetical protein
MDSGGLKALSQKCANTREIKRATYSALEISLLPLFIHSIPVRWPIFDRMLLEYGSSGPIRVLRKAFTGHFTMNVLNLSWKRLTLGSHYWDNS